MGGGTGRCAARQRSGRNARCRAEDGRSRTRSRRRSVAQQCATPSRVVHTDLSALLDHLEPSARRSRDVEARTRRPGVPAALREGGDALVSAGADTHRALREERARFRGWFCSAARCRAHHRACVDGRRSAIQSRSLVECAHRKSNSDDETDLQECISRRRLFVFAFRGRCASMYGALLRRRYGAEGAFCDFAEARFQFHGLRRSARAPPARAAEDVALRHLPLTD
mmetsp:Transcript_140/g.261  ORF Transcript_140/g.261 Transcript_140/m.261 type:complete len:226 (+) Transcript_140:743-1420(+)